MDKFNLEWFDALERREQWMLVLGGLALILYLFYVLAWRPLDQDNESLRKRNAEAADTLQWMRNSAAFIKQQQSAAPSAGGGQTLSQLLNASVVGGELRFSRFQPRGNDKAQVWFENTNFSQLFLWLKTLEEKQVSVSNVSVSSSAQSGLVSASLQLQKNN